MQATTVSKPNLSPSFDRARIISKWLYRLLTAGFWLSVIAVICVPGLLISVPLDGGTLNLNSTTVHLNDLTTYQRVIAAIGLIVMMVPLLFVLHHARHAFRHFVAGHVFAAEPINHIRQSGLWLMVSFGAAISAQIIIFIIAGIRDTDVDFDADFSTLIFGLIVYVAAYVMMEARRIADDNASIV